MWTGLEPETRHISRKATFRQKLIWELVGERQERRRRTEWKEWYITAAVFTAQCQTPASLEQSQQLPSISFITCNHLCKNAAAMCYPIQNTEPFTATKPGHVTVFIRCTEADFQLHVVTCLCSNVCFLDTLILHGQKGFDSLRETDHCHFFLWGLFCQFITVLITFEWWLPTWNCRSVKKAQTLHFVTNCFINSAWVIEGSCFLKSWLCYFGGWIFLPVICKSHKQL